MEVVKTIPTGMVLYSSRERSTSFQYVLALWYVHHICRDLTCWHPLDMLQKCSNTNEVLSDLTRTICLALALWLSMPNDPVLCAEGLTATHVSWSTFADDKFAATHLHWVYHIATFGTSYSPINSISQQFGSENRVYYTRMAILLGKWWLTSRKLT